MPFCDAICSFCPYNTLRTGSDTEDYVSLLLCEIDLYARVVHSDGIKFIYFGGGTPSTPTPRQIEKIISRLEACFGIMLDAEISLEAHPNHVSLSYLLGASNIGVNRISSGIQSFDQRTLTKLGCHHSAKTSRYVCEILANSLPNSGIDLLYRCKDQSLEDVYKEIEAFKEFGIPHLSLYSLYLPDSTDQASPEIEIEMAGASTQALKEAGFRHYASCATGGYDFAKAGRECEYELRHWAAPQASYLGIGVGAFGFVRDSVTINIHGLRPYRAAIQAGCLPILSLTRASREDLRHRYFTLGVKTLYVALHPYQLELLGRAEVDFREQFNTLEQLGLAHIQDGRLVLSPIGRHFVDQVSDVFLSGNQRTYSHPETTDLRRMERKLLRSPTRTALAGDSDA